MSEIILELIKEHIADRTFTHIIREATGFHLNGYCLKADEKSLLFDDRHIGKIIIPVADIRVLERSTLNGEERGDGDT